MFLDELTHMLVVQRFVAEKSLVFLVVALKREVCFRITEEGCWYLGTTRHGSRFTLKLRRAVACFVGWGIGEVIAHKILAPDSEVPEIGALGQFVGRETDAAPSRCHRSPSPFGVFVGCLSLCALSQGRRVGCWFLWRLPILL